MSEKIVREVMQLQDTLSGLSRMYHNAEANIEEEINEALQGAGVKCPYCRYNSAKIIIRLNDTSEELTPMDDEPTRQLFLSCFCQSCEKWFQAVLTAERSEEGNDDSE